MNNASSLIARVRRLESQAWKRGLVTLSELVVEAERLYQLEQAELLAIAPEARETWLAARRVDRDRNNRAACIAALEEPDNDDPLLALLQDICRHAGRLYLSEDTK